ncbi:Short C-terminal domain [Shewanella psychrophila]|uniref:Short C-terminal domain n=1 Tax=Shewanella psychrophila TaxID=225848 RepID=A0A1S6HXQ6_9GAMM|nr:SHOCT domain-containing protein [Shewanella psychrophila]AQS40252.1 Short C-terminal domain [Shewanella psychrophila]
MNNKIFFSSMAFLIISGCSSTGVIPMSQDSYFIGKKDGSPGIGVSLSNKAEVYQEANAFCSQKSLEVLTLRETVAPAAPGRLGSTELHFRCVQPGGSAKPLVKDADKVVNVNSNVNVKPKDVNSTDMYTELKKLKELKDTGIITQEEFDIEKKEVLSRY